PVQERAPRKMEAEKPLADRPQPEKSPAQRQAVMTPEKFAEERQAIKALTEKSGDKPSQMKARTVTAEPAPSRTRQGDQLAELIRGGIVPPAAVPEEADPRLLAIQKNLARLGYSSGKPDGMMGPGTRAAIERFEKDRKWPVTGEVTARLIRDLGTVSAGNRN
ncbi:MAG: peptidoglycan-binding domain-containing protein, partial [Beijerinckiaceae bacterium]